MPSPPEDPRAVSDRIERLLDDLAAAATDTRQTERAEELVRLVTELYGAGLARLVAMVSDEAPHLAGRLVEDDLVASLLAVHDLHPEGLRARVDGALRTVRPFLARHEGDVELLDIDPDAGAVLLRLLGSCDGCPSSAATLQGAVERAIREAAPEIVTVDVEEPSAAAGAGSDPDPEPGRPGDRSVPITLGRKPAYESCPTEVGEVMR